MFFINFGFVFVVEKTKSSCFMLRCTNLGIYVSLFSLLAFCLFTGL